MTNVMDDYPAHLLEEAEHMEKRAAKLLKRANYKRKLAGMTTEERHTHYEDMALRDESGLVDEFFGNLLHVVKEAAKEREEN